MRLAFLASAGTARTILGLPEVMDSWDQPSALREMTVSALAGHMTGCVTRIEEYLERTVPAGEMAVSAASYYATLLTTNDIQHPFHIELRKRAEKQASIGYAALIDAFDASVRRLRDRFADETEDRRIIVLGDLVMSLDDYLATRIVELSVHSDDMCASLRRETPSLPAIGIAIATLVDVARMRHGDLGVLRALARRERDPVEALRVF